MFKELSTMVLYVSMNGLKQVGIIASIQNSQLINLEFFWSDKADERFSVSVESYPESFFHFTNRHASVTWVATLLNKYPPTLCLSPCLFISVLLIFIQSMLSYSVGATGDIIRLPKFEIHQSWKLLATAFSKSSAMVAIIKETCCCCL